MCRLKRYRHFLWNDHFMPVVTVLHGPLCHGRPQTSVHQHCNDRITKAKVYCRSTNNYTGSYICTHKTAGRRVRPLSDRLRVPWAIPGYLPIGQSQIKLEISRL